MPMLLERLVRFCTPLRLTVILVFNLRKYYDLSDLHFDNDPVFGNNRFVGVPVHDCEAQLIYEALCGFFTGPNVQWIIAPYSIENSHTFYAPAYEFLGFKTWMQLGKYFSVFFAAKNSLDKPVAFHVDTISPTGQAQHLNQNVHIQKLPDQYREPDFALLYGRTIRSA